MQNNLMIFDLVGSRRRPELLLAHQAPLGKVCASFESLPGDKMALQLPRRVGIFSVTRTQLFQFLNSDELEQFRFYLERNGSPQF